MHEFLSTVTNPRRLRRASTMAEAMGALRAWEEQPSMSFLAEGYGHLDHLQRLLTTAKTAGPRVHDARVAAICLSHGVSTLWTADRDFALFPELKWENPLLT